MKFIFPVLLLFILFWPAGARADCLNTCLSRYSCKTHFEKGHIAGPEKCVKLHSDCEMECHTKGSYGAVALSPTKGVWGLAKKSPDEASAAKSALWACGEHAQDCEVAGQFRNLCAAVAQGEGGITSWSGAVDTETAGKNSIAACAQKGGKNCAVRASQCYTDPVDQTALPADQPLAHAH